VQVGFGTAEVNMSQNVEHGRTRWDKTEQKRGQKVWVRINNSSTGSSETVPWFAALPCQHARFD
jgi:hypothetical protein